MTFLTPVRKSIIYLNVCNSKYECKCRKNGLNYFEIYECESHGNGENDNRIFLKIHFGEYDSFLLL